MSRWRIVLVVVLLSVPFVVLVSLGSYYLWEQGLSFRAWWPMTLCFVMGYVLAWYWQRKKQLLHPVPFTPALVWTERDHEAWKLVEARAKAGGRINPERFVEFQFYVDLAEEMALELARFYHPRAKDPIGSLTVPELLAVIELAAHDLAGLVDQYLPGGHLLTINQWRQASKIPEWYSVASNLYWVVSALFNPLYTGLRYLTSQAGMSAPLSALQKDLTLWFYTAYVHRVGTYLIDLHSGRLQVGADRYRELLRQIETAAAPAPGTEVKAPAAGDPADRVGRVGLTVVGQVKAGKSSLINAILGEERAHTDVLPATGEVTRYELQQKGIPTRLVIFDTVGYGHAGPREDQLEATEEVARESDLVLVVVHALNPARQADLTMLERLRAWFAARPELKMPPVLAVMTHIDLLSPALEWAPPYDWVEPRRPKERTIRDACEAVREQLGRDIVGVVPLCTEPGKIYGLQEWFLPVLGELLDEARAVGFLRCLKAEANAGKIRKLFRQLLEAGKQAAIICLNRGGRRFDQPSRDVP